MRIAIVVGLLLFLAGCGGSYKNARQAFDSGQKQQFDVRQAFFTKAWGLNRALITESRKKWVNDAIIQTMDAAAEGKITTTRSREIIAKLEDELGKDEVSASENFAYLAYLLTAGYRGDEEMGSVDEFIEAQRPLWMQLFGSKEPPPDFSAQRMAELQAWEPLVKDLRSALPPQMIEKLKAPAPTSNRS